MYKKKTKASKSSPKANSGKNRTIDSMFRQSAAIKPTSQPCKRADNAVTHLTTSETRSSYVGGETSASTSQSLHDTSRFASRNKTVEIKYSKLSLKRKFLTKDEKHETKVKVKKQKDKQIQDGCTTSTHYAHLQEEEEQQPPKKVKTKTEEKTHSQDLGGENTDSNSLISNGNSEIEKVIDTKDLESPVIDMQDLESQDCQPVSKTNDSIISNYNEEVKSTDKKDEEYKVPYYLENFLLIMNTVTEDLFFQELFNDEDKKMAASFLSMTG